MLDPTLVFYCKIFKYIIDMEILFKDQTGITIVGTNIKDFVYNFIKYISNNKENILRKNLKNI